MTSFKRRVQNIVGYDENAPKSVDTVDWVRSHKGDIKHDVSDAECWFMLANHRLSPMSAACSRSSRGCRDTTLRGCTVISLRKCAVAGSCVHHVHPKLTSSGITVGMVLVPQSLSYAKIALLPAQYGLYSSFIGVLTYAFFATSKDVSIGPVAVMSLETGNIITKVQDKYGDLYSAPVIATALAFICGFIVLAIGLFRLGWIVEFSQCPRSSLRSALTFQSRSPLCLAS
jgi:sodium-independent sulfate anion transporter 11